ncbi:MAG: Arc family DNA-binding protein [Oscillospiraceae bacterium]|nr:Arc family DNA-binding protein [Oscillospiraceae bacterium]
MATDKIQTGLRLEEKALKKITFIAKTKKRSLNAQIEYAVQKCIEEYEKENGEIKFD